MSTPPPPDRPTEPLGRARPAPVVQERVVAPPPLVEERVVAPVVDPNVILLRLEDAVDNLRTWLLVVGIVAAAALGVALYAVLADDDPATTSRNSTSGLASDDRVTQIENRVDRLSRQLQDVRAGDGGGDDTAALANRVDQLEDAVKSQSGQGAASGTQDAVDELSGRIDDLASDVEELKQGQTP